MVGGDQRDLVKSFGQSRTIRRLIISNKSFQVVLLRTTEKPKNASRGLSVSRTLISLLGGSLGKFWLSTLTNAHTHTLALAYTHSHTHTQTLVKTNVHTLVHSNIQQQKYLFLSEILILNTYSNTRFLTLKLFIRKTYTLIHTRTHSLYHFHFM